MRCCRAASKPYCAKQAIRAWSITRRTPASRKTGTLRCVLACTNAQEEAARARQAKAEEGQGQSAGESRALLSCHEAPVETSHDALSRPGEGQRPAVDALRLRHPASGTQVCRNGARPGCVLHSKSGLKFHLKRLTPGGSASASNENCFAQN